MLLCALLPCSVQGARPFGGDIDQDVGTLTVEAGGRLHVHRPNRPRRDLDEQLPSRPPDLSRSSVFEKVRDIASSTAESRVDPAGRRADQVCERDVFARSEACPAACPFAAEMQNEFCHFRCVPGNHCGELSTVPNATIPDERMHACRHCAVEGCLRCVPGKPGEKGESLERCEVCMPAYELEDGECKAASDKVFLGVGLVTIVVAIAGFVWYLDVASRPVVNQAGLDYAMECRARQPLAQPDSPTADDSSSGTGGTGDVLVGGAGSRRPWPLTTNLLSTNVAGPGTMVMFRFEFAILVWGTVLLLAWLTFVGLVSGDLLVLGTKPASTPMELCAAVRWGRQRQLELIWTKVAWLAIAYVFSLVGAMAYGIQQAKLFAEIDNEHCTMSDYTAVLEGFRPVKGLEMPEKDLKEAVEKWCRKEIVGVSVAWDFSTKVSEVEHAMDQELAETERSTNAGGGEIAAGAPTESAAKDRNTASGEEPSAGDANGGAPGPPRRDPLTEMILGGWHVHFDEAGGSAPTEHGQVVKEMLQELSTAGKAFVIFNTEQDRDEAVEKARNQKIEIGDAGGCDTDMCTLIEEDHEPESVLWQNLHVKDKERISLLVRGSMLVAATCLAWCVVLYLPYGSYMASFSYANGDEPGFISESIFIGLVVGSQFGIFTVSSAAAKQACLHSEDQKQKVYIMFYNAALVLNLVLDLMLQTVLSYLQMVGVGAHVADGRLLGSLTSWQQIFESYPIQKSVGKLLFKYCFPSTFLVPFATEPLVAQWLPYHMGQLFVRSDPRIKGLRAWKVLELGEMEQGRYADCIFNAVLVTCVPFIAPAYMAKIFGAFILSHAYIYAYDQVKTLRYVVRFYFSSKEVHCFGQKLFALPVGILAAALVFKSNQMSAGLNAHLGAGVLQGYTLGAACTGAFFLHCVIHIGLLEHWVSGFEHTVAKEHAVETYAECAARTPCTYFSANPIQCLRSKYILNDSPALSPFRAGWEHTMKASPHIVSSCVGVPVR